MEKELTTNKDVYTHDRTYWGDNQKRYAITDEEYLLKKYIDKDDYVLEAGCGGGRLSFFMSDMGIEKVDAFDYVEQFISNAKQVESHINFFVADATDLAQIEDEKYDKLVYLQQVICFIPGENIEDAFKEAYRICKKNGKVIFSFLDFDGRKINKPLSVLLQFLRGIRREKLSCYELPWLITNGKKNSALLKKGQAVVYWFKKKELVKQLNNIGFEVIEDFYSEHKPKSTILYVVCKK